MRFILLASMALLISCSSSKMQNSNLAINSSDNTARTPASVETKRLLEIDERQGCCSHHNGVSHCSFGRIICNDGSASPSCGC